MQNEPIMIYKLIILYMLDKVSFSLTNQMISDYILGREYTNYFNLQTVLAELVEAELIALDTTYKTTYYNLTEKGRETLRLFHGQLSHEIREEIECYLKENKYSIVEEISSFADYKRISNGDYETTLAIKENGETAMELKLTVATENEATKICTSFSQKNEEVYQYLVKTLLN